MVVAKVASLVVVAALVTKLVAALVGKLVGHRVAGLLAGGKCRLAASDPRRRAQPPSREPVVVSVVNNDNDNINSTLMLNPSVVVSVVHNDNDNVNSTLILNPVPITVSSSCTTTTTARGHTCVPITVSWRKFLTREITKT